VKIPKLEIDKIYEVLWIDNNMPTTVGWMEDQEYNDFISNNIEDFVRSAGILKATNRRFITLAGDLDLGKVKSKMRLIKIFKPCIVCIAECKTKKIYEAKK